MSRREINMTEGNLWRQMFKYSVPLMFSNVLQVLFHMSDVAVVGRFAGPAALGAVGSTAILVTLFTGFIMGVSSGVNATVARYMGAQQHKDTQETVHTSGIICLGLGILVMTLGLIFSRPILELLGTKDVLIDGATLYLRIYLLGMPALGIFNFGNAVLSAAGDTKRPLYFLSTAGVINVILNLIFVIVFHMSVAGVALASIISQYISAVLILLSLRKAPENYALRKHELRISREKAGQVLALGLPTGFQYSIFAIANLFIQSGVNTFDALMVEGNSAAANADGLIYDVMAAFYTACTSFISQNVGAKKKNRILKCYGVSTVYSFGIAAVMGGLLVIFGKEFLSIFTTDAAVIEAGMHRLTVMGISYAFSAFMDNSIAASRGLGKSVIPTVIVIMGSCVFRIIWVYTVFAHFGTILSLYLLYIFSWSLTAIAENIYFFHIYRKQMKRLDT